MENNYKSLIISGEWKSPTQDQKEILVMKAQMECMKKQWLSKAKQEFKKKPPNDLEEVKEANIE